MTALIDPDKLDIWLQKDLHKNYSQTGMDFWRPMPIMIMIFGRKRFSIPIYRLIYSFYKMSIIAKS